MELNAEEVLVEIVKDNLWVKQSAMLIYIHTLSCSAIVSRMDQTQMDYMIGHTPCE